MTKGTNKELRKTIFLAAAMAMILSGGKLWTTWKDGVLFRANYDHSSKTHRCSVSPTILILQQREKMNVEKISDSSCCFNCII